MQASTMFLLYMPLYMMLLSLWKIWACRTSILSVNNSNMPSSFPFSSPPAACYSPSPLPSLAKTSHPTAVTSLRHRMDLQTGCGDCMPRGGEGTNKVLLRFLMGEEAHVLVVDALPIPVDLPFCALFLSRESSSLSSSSSPSTCDRSGSCFSPSPLPRRPSPLPPPFLPPSPRLLPVACRSWASHVSRAAFSTSFLRERMAHASIPP